VYFTKTVHDISAIWLNLSTTTPTKRRLRSAITRTAATVRVSVKTKLSDRAAPSTWNSFPPHLGLHHIHSMKAAKTYLFEPTNRLLTRSCFYVCLFSAVVLRSILLYVYRRATNTDHYKCHLYCIVIKECQAGGEVTEVGTVVICSSFSLSDRWISANMPFTRFTNRQNAQLGCTRRKSESVQRCDRWSSFRVELFDAASTVSSFGAGAESTIFSVHTH